MLVGLLGSIYSHTTEQDLKDDGECVRLMFSLERFMDTLHVLIDGHHTLRTIFRLSLHTITGKVLPPHTLSLNSQLPSATVFPLRESFPVIESNVDPLNVLRAFFAALAAVFLPPSFPVQFFLFVGVALPPQ